MSLLKTVSSILIHITTNFHLTNLTHQYEFERREFAQNLISLDRELAQLFSEKPQTAESQDGVSHEVLQK